MEKWLIILILICVSLAISAPTCGGGGDDDDSRGSLDDDDDITGDDDTAGDDATSDDDDDDADDDDHTGGDVWTDSSTGLMWQVWSFVKWEWRWDHANEFCEGLSLGGYTDWRLPTISEQRSLIRGCPATVTGGSCGVTDECLDVNTCFDETCDVGCPSGGGPDDGCYWPAVLEGLCLWEWSSSSVDPGVWAVYFGNAFLTFRHKHYAGQERYSARCVR